jgi:hypothetical protein
MVQNKLHYAITGQTAAEIIYNRVDQHKENILAEELIELQEKISKIKRKYNRLRQEIYDREDEINEQRDNMITEAKGKLTRTIKEEELFTVSFEII